MMIIKLLNGMTLRTKHIYHVTQQTLRFINEDSKKTDFIFIDEIESIRMY